MAACIGAPLLAAVIWGAVVAAMARWRLPIPLRVVVVVELELFGWRQAPWRVAGRPVLALVLGGAALATSLLNAAQERRSRADAPPR